MEIFFHIRAKDTAIVKFVLRSAVDICFEKTSNSKYLSLCMAVISMNSNQRKLAVKHCFSKLLASADLGSQEKHLSEPHWPFGSRSFLFICMSFLSNVLLKMPAVNECKCTNRIPYSVCEK